MDWKWIKKNATPNPRVIFPNKFTTFSHPSHRPQAHMAVPPPRWWQRCPRPRWLRHLGSPKKGWNLECHWIVWKIQETMCLPLIFTLWMFPKQSPILRRRGSNLRTPKLHISTHVTVSTGCRSHFSNASSSFRLCPWQSLSPNSVGCNMSLLALNLLTSISFPVLIKDIVTKLDGLPCNYVYHHLSLYLSMYIYI